jgi:cardiolipin synthase
MSTYENIVVEYWPYIAGTFSFFVMIVASAHAILHKRDARSAVAWTGIILLTPMIGAVLYVLFGINRIQRKATQLRRKKDALRMSARGLEAGPSELAESLPPEKQHLEPLDRFVARLTEQPLLRGNRVDPLVNGDEAYPAMLEAIDRAESSVSLATYLFHHDDVGIAFRDALVRARERGAEVRVLIDAVGARYTWPPMPRALGRAGITVARFLPTLNPLRVKYMNLRNHRKMLVVDGKVGFSGGMNIAAANRVARRPRRPVQDLHFRMEGPIVTQLQETFAEDWAFTTGEILEGPRWFPDIDAVGETFARGIADGPDRELDHILWTILGALDNAHESVRIVTPYFVPDAALVTALNLAAMSGVEVDILLPEKNNHVLVKWASTAMLWQVLQRGCRVWRTPPPFDHTKLMIVDGTWMFLGSSNWDARSLRLNFEFNVECYDADLVAKMEAHVQAKKDRARRITLEDVDGRALPIRLRDGVARLLSPYL